MVRSALCGAMTWCGLRCAGLTWAMAGQEKIARQRRGKPAAEDDIDDFSGQSSRAPLCARDTPSSCGLVPRRSRHHTRFRLAVSVLSAPLGPPLGHPAQTSEPDHQPAQQQPDPPPLRTCFFSRKPARAHPLPGHVCTLSSVPQLWGARF
eukprot:2026537-Rhodomonas_salina.2